MIPTHVAGTSRGSAPSFFVPSMPAASSYGGVVDAMGNTYGDSGVQPHALGGFISRDNTVYAGQPQGQQAPVEEVYRPAAHPLDTDPDTPLVFSSNVVPKRKEVANASLVPIGCVWRPVSHGSDGAVLLRGAGRCDKCKAFPNPFCSVDTGSGAWVCALCNHKNNSGAYKGVAKDVCPELVRHTVEYVDPVAQPNLEGNTPGVQHVVFVIDANLTETALAALKTSMNRVLDGLHDDTRVALITYASVVCAYEISGSFSPYASSEVFAGSALPAAARIRALRKRHASFFGTKSAVLETLKNIVASWQPTLTTEIVVREPRRALGAALEVALALCEAARDAEIAFGRARGNRWVASSFVGKIAVTATGSPNYGPGGVIAPGNDAELTSLYVDKAFEYLTELSRRALTCETIVDVFCGGNNSFSVPVLHSLAIGNGGLVLIHNDFGERFSSNLGQALRRSAGYAGVIDVVTSFPMQVSRIIGPAVSFASVQASAESLSEEASKDLGEDARLVVPLNTQLNKDSPNLCRTGGVQAQHSFSVFFDYTDDIIPDHICLQFVHEYTNWQNQRIVRVTTKRLATTTSNATFVRAVNVESAAVLLAKRFVLLARKLGSSWNRVNEDIDDLIRDLGAQLGTQSNTKGGKALDKVYELPPDLMRLALALFHLRRGGMLGEILQHMDDIDALRCLFLNANINVCWRIIQPRLLSIQSLHRLGGAGGGGRAGHGGAGAPPFTPMGGDTSMNSSLNFQNPNYHNSNFNNNNGTSTPKIPMPHHAPTPLSPPLPGTPGGSGSGAPGFGSPPMIGIPGPDETVLPDEWIEGRDYLIHELPLENLALQSDVILYLDHFTDIMIWSGEHTFTDPSYDSLREIFTEVGEKVVASRFPVPELKTMKENSSMSRWLTCRLIPSHRDPWELQKLSFPEFARWPEEKRKKLIQKFQGMDDQSFREYYRALFA